MISFIALQPFGPRPTEPIRAQQSVSNPILELLCLPKAQAAAARVLWKLKKAYSLGIPKKKLARGKSQTEEEHAYGEEYTICRSNGRFFWT